MLTDTHEISIYCFFMHHKHVGPNRPNNKTPDLFIPFGSQAVKCENFTALQSGDWQLGRIGKYCFGAYNKRKNTMSKSF